ncbi:hypothetical protein ACETK8_15730 [Brevundimonas staleyi]|uniref:Chemotaxis protein n=1 Tax=Brevundimonas staleyi TaxID=74326 RepID=A0ABW0FXK6_9CAUL
MAGLSLIEQLGGGAVLVAAGGGLMKGWQTWCASRRSPEQRMGDAAQAASVLVTAATQAAEGLMAGMREDLDALRAELSATKASHAQEIAELKLAHDQCTAENLVLKGHLDQQIQRTESLAAFLRRQGLEVPDLTGARPLLILTANTSPETA